MDLPKLIDALGDLAYVIEGTAACCGVDMRPIAAEIHRANMEKTWNGEGKPTKGPGWVEPNIVGELREQGWQS